MEEAERLDEEGEEEEGEEVESMELEPEEEEIAMATRRLGALYCWLREESEFVVKRDSIQDEVKKARG